jgi:hypothetical protein
VIRRPDPHGCGTTRRGTRIRRATPRWLSTDSFAGAGASSRANDFAGRALPALSSASTIPANGRPTTVPTVPKRSTVRRPASGLSLRTAVFVRARSGAGSTCQTPKNARRRPSPLPLPRHAPGAPGARTGSRLLEDHRGQRDRGGADRTAVLVSVSYRVSRNALRMAGRRRASAIAPAVDAASASPTWDTSTGASPMASCTSDDVRLPPRAQRGAHGSASPPLDPRCHAVRGT